MVAGKVFAADLDHTARSDIPYEFLCPFFRISVIAGRHIINILQKRRIRFCKSLDRMDFHPRNARAIRKYPGVARLTFHPIQTFAEPDPSLLKNIYYMASSNDAYAKKWAKKFVRDIGASG